MTAQHFMKRTVTALVEYSGPDSDDEDTPDTADKRTKDPQPTKKRYVREYHHTLKDIHSARKLPPLSSSLVVPVPIDNPALHQGRLRSTPHVEGHFATHVYVSLTVNRHSQLYQTIQDILSDARMIVPSLNDMWPSETRQHPELHISLSRPIFLRAHQREDFKRAVRNAAKSQKP